MDCIFCKIVNKELPTDILSETDEVIAFKDIKPSASTHILIVPKKHIPSFTDITKNDNLLIGEMIKMGQNIIKDYNITDGYKILFNGGSYQYVSHLHMHVMGGTIMINGTTVRKVK